MDYIRHPSSGTLRNKGYHTLGHKKGQRAIAVMQVRWVRKKHNATKSLDFPSPYCQDTLIFGVLGSIRYHVCVCVCVQKINNYTSISFSRSLKEKLLQLHHARHFSLCLPVCLCILCYSSEIIYVCVYIMIFTVKILYFHMT